MTLRKDHPSLFKAYIGRGIAAFCIGGALIYDNKGSWMNIVGGGAMLAISYMKIYGAFRNYELGKTAMMIGVIFSATLYVTLKLGLRQQSGLVQEVFWLYYIYSQSLLIKEFPSNPLMKK